MRHSPVQQACDHKAEAAEKHEGNYQLVMHPDTLVRILAGTTIGKDNPGVFETIKQADLPLDVIKLYGAPIHLDDRVLVGSVNRRPC